MLLPHHSAKIVTPERLLQATQAARAVGETMVMCHGVFDVVHPGHLRHLLYAESKADILVCSITADEHIGKGVYRPHVPQDLRAANLALLDIVDFVVINDAHDPTKLIAKIKPDFYAKGFEYAPGQRPRQIPEAAVLESYGGVLLFTPGDIVFSSSELIAAAAPDLRWDKLALLMRLAGLEFDDLRHVASRLHGRKVHVVGDTIVDALLHCEMIGSNTKTPTISVRRGRRDLFVGGAAVVALHARAAGADVSFSTVLGSDQDGAFVDYELRSAGVTLNRITDRARPTTVKEAVVVDGYRLLKIDTVDNRPISDAVLCELLGQVHSTRAGLVVYSDFRHGIFNPRTIGNLLAAVPEGCLRAADSQVASRWGNIVDFQGFDLLTPNEREARFALGDQDSGVRSLAASLHSAARCKYLILKLGERGLLGFGPAGDDTSSSFALDAFAGDVVDPVGAGDALLAYASLVLESGAGLPEAAIIGSFAAAAACEYDGNVPVTLERVLARIDDAEKVIGGD